LTPIKAISKGEATLTEAKKLNFKFNFEPPQMKKCEFCGVEIEPVCLHLNGFILGWKPDVLMFCNCEKGIEKREIYSKQQAEIKAREENQKRLEEYNAKLKKLLDLSGIKLRTQSKTFENYICKFPQQIEVFNIAKSYADNFEIHKKDGLGLYFEGYYGTGKSHLATAISIELLKKLLRVINKTSIDLLGDIRKCFDTNEDEYEVLKLYKTADLLVIDDIGKEKVTEWSLETIYNIINARYESLKPTIITTNYNQQQLIGRWTLKGDNSHGMAIISRFREMTKAVPFGWNDYRFGGQT
jgi:DNA replication protein DnaC